MKGYTSDWLAAREQTAPPPPEPAPPADPRARARARAAAHGVHLTQTTDGAARPFSEDALDALAAHVSTAPEACRPRAVLVIHTEP